MNVIARMRSAFPTKFGIPRQSNLVKSLHSTIVFEPDYRSPEAVRGLAEFSHIWVIWQFSQAVRQDWSPTVRPPRLGGNIRVGVFATRSPFRPNSLGLSALEIDRVEICPDLGPLIHVWGADLLDETPIFDIKPYVPFADCLPQATGAYASSAPEPLRVVIPEAIGSTVPAAFQSTLNDVLAQDPRPSYHDDPKRTYGMEFGGYHVRFSVSNGTVTVCELNPLRDT